MASTYTTELRIEKIATGAQSGTWGTTTGTQYDLWESTISGTVAVAFASDGNDTLTTANGSDDEARHMVINLTGGATLTATRNMVVPTSSKLYIVANNTTGSQAVQIIGASGTGITIPNAQTMFLRHDGTNVVEATGYDIARTIATLTATTLTATTLNTANAQITGGAITGITDLAVADGGTGASTLTDGGVLLGSGTGAVTAMAAMADGEMIVGDGTTDPVLESGATLRTSIGVGTGDSPQFTGIELGHATDTTITRVSAGLIAVEGDTVPMLATAQTFSKTQSGSITALTSTTNSIAVDAALNNHFSHTFTENTTLANPTNLVAGTSGSFFLTQHASSPKTLAFGSYYKFAGGTAPTVTATNSAVDRIDYIVATTTSIECVWTGAIA